MRLIATLLLSFFVLASQAQTKVYGKYNYFDSLTFSKYKNNVSTDSILTTDVNGRLQLVKPIGKAANDSGFISGFTTRGRTKQLTDSMSAAITILLAAKQATLVSGTNIKTINSNTLLGSGDLSVSTLIGFTPENVANKNTNNGYAGLDAGGKVPFSLLPAALMIYKGTWNVATNTPTLSDGTGVSGWVYIVSTGGTVNTGSGSITYLAGDYAIHNGSIWQRSVGTNNVSSVNSQQGVVTLTTANISEVTNLYYTDARARAAHSLTTTGSSGAATYSSSTGAFNIPNYTLSGLGGQPLSTNLTSIGGLANAAGVLVNNGSGTFSYSTTPTLTGTNFSGTAASLTVGNATNAGNATTWNGQIYGGTYTTGTVASMLVYNSTSSDWRLISSIPTALSGTITTVGTLSAGSIPYSLVTGGPTALPTTNALTMNNGGAGATSGTTFNGSAAQTISYNTIGAQPQLSGTGFVKATGTTISYDNSTYLTTAAASTAYVPYTGATVAVNLGTNTLASGAITVNSSSGIINSTNQGTAASFLTFANTGGTTYLGRENSTGSGFGATAYSTILNSSGAYPLEFWVNGAKQMYLSSTGGLVVGTTINSGGDVTLNGAAGNRTLTVQTNTSGDAILALLAAGSDGSSIKHSRSLDQLIFGVGAVTDALHLASTGAATFSSSVTATGAVTVLSTTASSSTSTGALVVSGGLGVATASYFGGNVTGLEFFASSDARLKNIVGRSNDMVLFKWKPELKRDTKLHYGYIAQEVKKFMPDAVNADDAGNLSVDYIQVLVKKVNDLENRIKQLEK